jgi:hypothetical protein
MRRKAPKSSYISPMPAPCMKSMYSVTLKDVTFSYNRKTMIFRATPPCADTTVTLGAHNIAFFFVLASRMQKNTSTPPPNCWLSLKTC